MATDSDAKSPWTRPGFVGGAIVVALILVLAGILAVKNLTDDDASPPPTPSTSVSPSSAPSTPSADGSVCGLEGLELAGSINTAPPAEWAFQGTTAYPTSTEFGPGKTDEETVRYCYQHSPTGALFAAANAVVQGSDTATQAAFARYFIASGPGRDAAITKASSSSPTSGRLEIAGFRMLQYEGTSARVDIAVRATSGASASYGSAIYPLVWQDGDWRLVVTSNGDLQFAVTQLPDLAGYTSWGSE